MEKRTIIIICIILAIIIGIITGIYITDMHNKGEVKENLAINNKQNIAYDINKVQTTSSEEEKVLPNTILIMKQYYKECGHMVEEQYVVPEEIVNMTKSQVENYYSNWKLLEFSKEKIEIYKETNQKCDEHYIVKESNGYIAVYTVGIDGEEKLVETTKILTKYLPKEDQERLKNGVNVVGKKDLSICLEDFE